MLHRIRFILTHDNFCDGTIKFEIKLFLMQAELEFK